MIFLIIFACLIIILFIVTVVLVKPANVKNIDFSLFTKNFVAHRGLFDNSATAPENSILAFTEAVNAGYGIELDVQLSKDNRVVVFHDEKLFRATGVKGLVRDYSYSKLSRMCLFNSEQHIPLFEDVLKTINGKVPIIVEIKPEGNWKRTCRLVAKLLDNYNGIYCIESFDPRAVEWFKIHRPEVIRGQLSTNYFKDKINVSFIKKFLLSNLLINFKSKPHFIAYNYKYKNHFGYWLCRKIFHPINVAWTIKSQLELDKNKNNFDCFIFDSFTPRSLKRDKKGE